MKLEGIKVLVTRPDDQADRLCRLIQDQGGEAIHFPVMEISRTGNDDKAREILLDVASFTHVIFVSINAVRFAWQLVPDLAARMQSAQVFATGKGTLDALKKEHVDNTLCNRELGGSEGLLELESLSGNAVSGRKVLIVRGSGGRELLANGLRQSGAEVYYADVYLRRKPDIEVVKTEAIWRDSGPDMIVVTSGTGLHNLVEIMGSEYRDELLKCRLVVISDRVGRLARTLGFVFEPVVAKEMTDEGLLNAIIEIAESQQYEHRK